MALTDGGSGAAYTPLAGVRILDLSWFLAGPYGTQILADLGAEVIKVEPEAGDASRAIPPHFYRGESAYYMSINRNKQSVVVDLKHPDGRAVLLDLAARCDVMLESFRPGVAERLGIDYTTLSARNPALVVCSLTGFGLDGPYSQRPAYDMIVQAMSGGMSLTGEPEGRPVRAGVPIGDLAAGMFSAIGILAALREARLTGRGRHLDVSMLDCQVSLLTYQAAYHLLSGEVPGPQGRGHVSFPTYRAFAAADGVDVLITANTEAMWRALCEVLDLPRLADDPRFRTNADRLANRAELDALLEERFRARPSDVWLPLLQDAGIPAAPVNTLDRALSDPHVQARRMVVEVPHARGGTVRLLGNPVKAAGVPEPGFASPPLLGQHTADVLRRVLGYDAERVKTLSASGAVRQREAILEATPGGAKVRYRTWGTGGPRLLLIHPVGLDADFWEPVADRLADRFRLLAYDLPGHGGSDPPRGAGTMEDLADHAADVLRAAGFLPAAVAGLSIGGMVAMHLALRHPDAVQALVLADTLARGSEVMLGRARAAREQGMEALIAPTLERWYPPAFLRDHPEVADAVARRLRSDDPEAHARAWEAIAGHDASEGLSRLSVPTLVLVGTLDVSTPPAVAEGIATAIPGAQLDVIAGAGHLAPFQDPDAFARRVSAFLSPGPSGSPERPA